MVGVDGGNDEDGRSDGESLTMLPSARPGRCVAGLLPAWALLGVAGLVRNHACLPRSHTESRLVGQRIAIVVARHHFTDLMQ